MIHPHGEDAAHMVIVQCVVNGFALAPEPHELGILEHPQLMAHRRLAELDGICNVLHAQLIVVEGVEYLDAGEIGRASCRERV